VEQAGTAPAAENSPMPDRSHMNPSPANSTILVLVSDPLMRTVFDETLQRAGYLVIAAGDLGSAVDRLKEMRPDLLLIRPYISSMPGHMAADYLRTKCPGLPVMIVAGLMDDDRVHVQNAVEDFYVFPKPFPASEFLEKVKEVLLVSRHKAS
jgi:DNA-binding response OmpR family regulator